jgi:hypothetical protein
VAGTLSILFLTPSRLALYNLFWGYILPGIKWLELEAEKLTDLKTIWRYASIQLPPFFTVVFKFLPLYFPFYYWGGVRLSPLGTSATSGPTVPASGDRRDVEPRIWQGKLKHQEKICPIATLYTSKQILLAVGSNLAHHGVKATNRPSSGHCLCFSVLLCEYSPLRCLPSYVLSKFSTPVEASPFISIKAVSKIMVRYIYYHSSHYLREIGKIMDSELTSSDHYWNWNALNFIVNTIYICHCRTQLLIEIYYIFKWCINNYDLSLYPSH